MFRFVRIGLFAFCLFLSHSLFAAYIYTGNGSWFNAANWGGTVPSFHTSDDIWIYGNCTLTLSAGQLVSANITIWPGGTLTIDGPYTLTNYGHFEIKGALVNKAYFEHRSSISITGTFTNQGTFDDYTGSVPLLTGGTFINTNTGVILPETFRLAMQQGSSFTNNGIMAGGYNFATSGQVVNNGTLSPNYFTFNKISIGGNYTATATSTQNIKVGGTSAGSYASFQIGGSATLDGTLNVNLTGGFIPTSGNPDLPIITANSITGTFATVNKPSQYQLIYNAGSVMLRPVAVLPIRFSSVELKKEGSGLRLYWNMQSETNIARYEVEKSRTGTSYSKVGEISRIGQTSYSFADLIWEEKSYYRVKCVDKEGREAYSVIVTTGGEKSTIPFLIYPSLARTSISIQHETATSDSKISVFSIDGRWMQTIYPANGAQQSTLDVSGLGAGTYLINYYGHAGALQTARFMKQ